MTGYLESLANHVAEREPVVRPRLRGWFEPPQSATVDVPGQPAAHVQSLAAGTDAAGFDSSSLSAAAWRRPEPPLALGQGDLIPRVANAHEPEDTAALSSLSQPSSPADGADAMRRPAALPAREPSRAGGLWSVEPSVGEPALPRAHENRNEREQPAPSGVEQSSPSLALRSATSRHEGSGPPASAAGERRSGVASYRPAATAAPEVRTAEAAMSEPGNARQSELLPRPAASVAAARGLEALSSVGRLASIGVGPKPNRLRTFPAFDNGRQRALEQPPAASPMVNVSIGRIEVRAFVGAKPSRLAAKPSLSLESYLTARNKGRT